MMQKHQPQEDRMLRVGAATLSSAALHNRSSKDQGERTDRMWDSPDRTHCSLHRYLLCVFCLPDRVLGRKERKKMTVYALVELKIYSKTNVDHKMQKYV